MRFLGLFCLFVALGTVNVFADAFAKRTLRVGSIIEPGDLHVRNSDDVDLLSGLMGLEVRRAVYAGHIVTKAHLGPPTLVHRNEIVAMTYRSGSLGIRTEGRALARGGKGEVVDVMNLTSRMTVRAIVIGPRQVEVQR